MAAALLSSGSVSGWVGQIESSDRGNDAHTVEGTPRSGMHSEVLSHRMHTGVASLRCAHHEDFCAAVGVGRVVGEAQLVAALARVQHPVAVQIEEVRAVVAVVHLPPARQAMLSASGLCLGSQPSSHERTAMLASSCRTRRAARLPGISSDSTRWTTGLRLHTIKD